MQFYTARKAIEYFTYEIEKEEIRDENSLHSIELTLASLYTVMGDKAAALEMCDRVLNCDDSRLKRSAYEIKGAI